MTNIEQLKADLRLSWDGLPVGDLCARLLDYICSVPVDQASMFTYSTFANAVGKVRVDPDLINAISILVSSSIQALDSRALFIDGEEEYDLSTQELSRALKEHILIHPETGEPVHNFMAQVMPYFVPSQRFLEMMGKNDA